MSPVQNKVEVGSREEVDESLHSSSIRGEEEEEENSEGVAAIGGGHTTTPSNNNITPHKHKESTDSTKLPENSNKTTPEATETSKKAPDKDTKAEHEKEIVSQKARSLATYIVTSLTSDGGKIEANKDVIEVTLLRCVKTMMEKHQILFKGQMKRLGITRETGYPTFVGVVNELFEVDGQGKVVVTWSRIVAFYAFGAEIAIYCQEKDMGDFIGTITEFLGQYAADVLTPFIVKSGGWAGLGEEFPANDDLENKAWKFLTWTAIGLGLAATASFFTSH